MFNKIVSRLLEEYNILSPLNRAPVTQGPNIDFRGPQVSGFLGGGLPAINPSTNISVRVKKKKKKKLNKRA